MEVAANSGDLWFSALTLGNAACVSVHSFFVFVCGGSSARLLRKSGGVSGDSAPGSRPGRTRAVGGQSTGADTGSRRTVDRGGHGQSEGTGPSGVAGARPA